MKKALIIHKEVRLKSYFRKIKRGFIAHGSDTSVSQREVRLKSYFQEIVSIFFVLFFTGCSNLPDYEIDSWKTLIDPAFDQERVVKFYTDQVKKYQKAQKRRYLSMPNFKKH